jgi:hypothetical protein
MDLIPARSDRGKIRTIVRSEDHVEKGGVAASAKYFVPSGLKTYTFETVNQVRGDAAVAPP